MGSKTYSFTKGNGTFFHNWFSGRNCININNTSNHRWSFFRASSAAKPYAIVPAQVFFFFTHQYSFGENNHYLFPLKVISVCRWNYEFSRWYSNSSVSGHKSPSMDINHLLWTQLIQSGVTVLASGNAEPEKAGTGGLHAGCAWSQGHRKDSCDVYRNTCLTHCLVSSTQHKLPARTVGLPVNLVTAATHRWELAGSWKHTSGTSDLSFKTCVASTSPVQTQPLPLFSGPTRGHPCLSVCPRLQS